MVDKNLFIYLTKDSGHSLEDVCTALDISMSALYSKLRGSSDFSATEISDWAQLINVSNDSIISTFFTKKGAF